MGGEKRSAYLSYVRRVESSRIIRLVKEKKIKKNTDANVLRKPMDINVV